MRIIKETSPCMSSKPFGQISDFSKRYFYRSVIDRLYPHYGLQSLQIPKFSVYGFRVSDLEIIANESINKHNPVKLEQDDIKIIIFERI